jgi:hypothetical protein
VESGKEGASEEVLLDMLLECGVSGNNVITRGFIAYRRLIRKVDLTFQIREVDLTFQIRKVDLTFQIREVDLTFQIRKVDLTFQMGEVKYG